MLHEFITTHRDDIVDRTWDHVRRRPSPEAQVPDVEHAARAFLAQLIEMLRRHANATPFSNDAIGSTATHRGAELLAAGCDVSQVVYGYGDICQAITEIAVERSASITVDEFHTLNGCLDTAIAEAVAEHTRLMAQKRSDEEVERLGRSAHDLRDLLHGAILAFHVLKRGSAPMDGRAGTVLGRNLTSMLACVDRDLSEVRLGIGRQRRESISVATFVNEIAATGMLYSQLRGIRFTMAPVDPTLRLEADPQMLASAVTNLLHNAFKNTRSGGGVSLLARADGQRLFVEIEDECGGIRERHGDLFQAFGNQPGTDRSGLGLGLSLARRAVQAHDGCIRIRNVPGRGCVFTIDVPLAAGSR